MHRTEGENNSSNLFVDGPPGTRVEEDWLNAVQEEIAYVIETAGLTLKTASTETQTQLYAAIAALFEVFKDAVTTMPALTNITPSVIIGTDGAGDRSVRLYSADAGRYISLSTQAVSDYLLAYGGDLNVGTYGAHVSNFLTDNTVRMSIAHTTGTVNVVGTFTAGVKTFIIDHPIEPIEKTLTHSVFEGPEHGLIYRGKTNLIDGKAVINFDEHFGMISGTFAALTQDVVVQSLQNQDGFDRVMPGILTQDSFEIISENLESTDEIAWVVMAARADKLIKTSDINDSDGRLILETKKD